jgi:MYXO-CTERM domain-containing protein
MPGGVILGLVVLAGGAGRRFWEKRRRPTVWTTRVVAGSSGFRVR